MFGYNPRRFALIWVLLLLTLGIGAAMALGSNSLTGTMDIFAGFAAVGDLFGGWGTILGLLVVIIGVVGAFLGIRHIAKTNYEHRANALGIIGVIILVVVAVVGVSWIKIDTSAWPTFGGLVAVIVLVTVFALIATPRNKGTKVMTAAQRALAALKAPAESDSTEATTTTTTVTPAPAATTPASATSA